MYSADYGAPYKSLKTQLIEATEAAVAATDLPGATIHEILAKADIPVGYVEDYRRAAFTVTEIVAYTLKGDPLHDVKED